MSNIKDHIGRIADSKWFENVVLGTLVAAAILSAGAQVYSTVRASNSNPPVYRDVNGDGVEDKIVQKNVENPGLLWMNYYTLEDEVSFGVEANGKKLYLPKDQFEGYQK